MCAFCHFALSLLLLLLISFLFASVLSAPFAFRWPVHSISYVWHDVHSCCAFFHSLLFENVRLFVRLNGGLSHSNSKRYFGCLFLPLPLYSMCVNPQGFISWIKVISSISTTRSQAIKWHLVCVSIILNHLFHSLFCPSLVRRVLNAAMEQKTMNYWWMLTADLITTSNILMCATIRSNKYRYPICARLWHLSQIVFLLNIFWFDMKIILRIMTESV